MSIKFIVTIKRPSTDIPWTNLPNEAGWFTNDSHYVDNWHEQGRLISTTATFSDDGLNATVIREFVDWQALDDFIGDVNLNQTRMARSSYHDAVGIEMVNMETVEV